MFKICVIGCGGMSKTGHGISMKKYFDDYEDVCLAACCDLREEVAIEYKEKFGFERHYTDYLEMLNTEKPDVVSVIMPVNLTKQMAINVIKMGYNIIIEKPPGKDVDEINEMIKAAKEEKVNVRVSFNRRFVPLIMKLMESIEKEGEPIYNITYQMYRNGRYDNDFSTTAIHAIDVVKYIGGADYDTVNFDYQHLPKKGENVKNIYLNCKLKNGVHANIDLVPTGGGIFERISVNTDNHTYFVNIPIWQNYDNPGELLHFQGNKLVERIDGASLVDTDENFERAGFYDANRTYFEHLRNNDFIISDLESSIQSVELEDCVRKSIESYKA